MSPQSALRVGLIQTRTPATHEAALAHVAPLVREAASQGAQFILTPEGSNVLQKDRAKLLPSLRSLEDDIVVRGLRDLAAEQPVIGDVRGRGAMLAIELVQAGSKEPNPELTKAVAAACLKEGVIILTCGTYGNVIRLLPPLVISDELLLDGLQVLAAAIKANA